MKEQKDLLVETLIEMNEFLNALVDWDTIKNEKLYNEYLKLQSEIHKLRKPESIQMLPVTSSQIKSVGWRDNTLFIEFTKGTVYSYSNVPETFFEALRKAESVGKYFGSEIKGKFEFSKTDKVVVNNQIL